MPILVSETAGSEPRAWFVMGLGWAGLMPSINDQARTAEAGSWSDK